MQWLRSLGSVACFLLLMPAAALAQDTVRAVALEEAIRLSLQRDPAAVAAAGEVSTAGADLLQARGAWLPSLGVNSTYANSSNERLDQTTGRLVSENYTARAEVGYDLFTGGRRLVVQRSAAAQVRAAEASYRAQRFQTILATTRTFYAAAASVELLEVARQRLERARQQLSFAETRLEVGTATRSDVLRAELEVGNAELAVLDAELALRSARLQLGRQIGVEEEVHPAAATLPERVPHLPSVEAIAARAEQVSPRRLAAQAGLESRRTLTQAAYTAFLPTLRGTAGYDWFSFDFPPTQQSWSVRVFASLPVFNGFQRESAIARARVAERVADARLRDAIIGAQVEAENAARQIGAAERRVEIARRAVELAREDLRVQEERYQIGAATILDLQTSQVALADAEAAFVRARQALGVSVAELEAVLGETLTP